jgi:PleD family two-component response regulator
VIGEAPPDFADALPNIDQVAADPRRLVARMVPLVRMRAFEGRLKRMLKSLDTDGISDPQTGLLTRDSFWRDLKKVMAESADRSLPLSVSFFIRQHNRRTCQTRCHTIDDPVDPQYRLCGAR